MNPERTYEILKAVFEQGRIPTNTTADEVEKLDDLMFYEDESWSLTSLGEMELEDFIAAKQPAAGSP